MAGEKFPEFPESSEITGRLDTVISLLTDISAGVGHAVDLVRRYQPALDKAARLVDSPAARVASKLSRVRPAAPNPKENRR